MSKHSPLAPEWRFVLEACAVLHRIAEHNEVRKTKKKSSSRCSRCRIRVELGMVLVGLAEDVHLEALVRVNGESLRQLVCQLCRHGAMLYSHMSLGYPLTNLVCLGSDVTGLGPRHRLRGLLDG